MGKASGYRRIWRAFLLACVLAMVAGTIAIAQPERTLETADARAAYKNPQLPVHARVDDLLERMTLEEKIGQMGQINSWVLLGSPDTPWDWPADFNLSIVDDVFGTDKIGSVLSGGGAWPPPPQFTNDGRGWAEFTNQIQEYALDPSRNRLGIPVIFGVDAVHGHNNLSTAINVPHQIGLGATFDPDLVRRLGGSTAQAVRATGAHWNFAPVLDTQRDARWGRSYEPFSEDPLVNGILGAAFIRGSEGRDLSHPGSVAATAKHFTGYSAPDSGHDRTDATIPEAELQDLHVPPFEQAVDAGVATVMINSGSVNGEPAHSSSNLLTDILRDQLGFEGVTISDWNDIEALWHKYGIADNMEDAIATAFNAGVDISMIPTAPDNRYDPRPDHGYFENAVNAVQNGKLSEERVDEAVARILTLKFELGLFDDPYVDPSQANAAIEDPFNSVLAKRAAQESLVLLENDGTLPFSADGRILVTGPQSDSAAHQLGGWTVGWQGAFNLPPQITVPEVTTLREGIEQAAPSGTEVLWRQGAPVGDTTNRDPSNPHPEINDPDHPDVAAARAEALAAAQDVDTIVVAVGESPYAEGQGDDDTPEITGAQARLVDELVATGKPVVVVIMAGRPLVMNEQLDGAAAALMAWLPGNEGGAAIAEALFGRYNPGGRLSVSWPKSSDQQPLAYNEPGTSYDPRYPFGHGLSYSDVAVTELDAPSDVGRRGRVPVHVELSNSSSVGGSHIVLALVERIDGPAGAAPRQLVAFERTAVEGNDLANVRLGFRVEQLAVTLEDGTKSVVPGEYRLIVGEQSRTFLVH